MDGLLQLDNVRHMLVRLEETIIFALMERAQFRRNENVYRPGVFGPAVGEVSLLGYCLRETERVHARMRRYTSPDEHPFSGDLPEPVLPELIYRDNPLHPNAININDRVFDIYVSEMIPLICAEGDDEQYGSSAVADVSCLQALSQRVHYGKFVAESKYRANRTSFDARVAAGDRDGLMAEITERDMEETVLQRVGSKARTYAGELNATSSGRQFDPEKVVELYRQWIIPLNKDVQVKYLLCRSGVGE